MELKQMLFELLRAPGITGAEDDLARLDSLLSEVHLMMHHSRAFEEAYHPHYRIIAKDIFESELKPLIDR